MLANAVEIGTVSPRGHTKNIDGKQHAGTGQLIANTAHKGGDDIVPGQCIRIAEDGAVRPRFGGKTDIIELHFVDSEGDHLVDDIQQISLNLEVGRVQPSPLPGQSIGKMRCQVRPRRCQPFIVEAAETSNDV